MHEFDAFAADETSFIPLAQFDNVMQFITTPDYPHLRWTRSVSRVPSQAYLKEMLKYLQWQDGGKRERVWVLKNPGNTGEVVEMLEVFPNATFVISQRDLYKTMASSMRMGVEILRNTFEPLDTDGTSRKWHRRSVPWRRRGAGIERHTRRIGEDDQGGIPAD